MQVKASVDYSPNVVNRSDIFVKQTFQIHFCLPALHPFHRKRLALHPQAARSVLSAARSEIRAAGNNVHLHDRSSLSTCPADRGDSSSHVCTSRVTLLIPARRKI